MQKAILIIIFLSLNFLSFGQEINIGTRDAIFSKILNQDRPFSVYFPPSYYANTTQKYPVLYILDGGYNFQYVTGLIELQSSIGENIPEMIVVGISGKGTPTYRKNCKPNIKGLEDAGNADETVQFIEKELIPYIQNKYKAADYKILAGHSVGGLFIINTALHNPQLFNHYIAISPALWWANNAINTITTNVLAQNSTFKSDVYVSLADEKGMGVNQFLGIATDRIWAKSVVKYGMGTLGLLLAIFIFLNLRKNNSSVMKKVFYPLFVMVAGIACSLYLLFLYYPQDSNFKFKQFPNENHNTVGAPTYQWALNEIFKDWKVEKRYFDNTEALTKYHDKVSQKYGGTFNLPNGTLANTALYILKDNAAELNKMQKEVAHLYPNSTSYFNTLLAGNYMEAKHFAKAEQLLVETLKNQPNSFDCYQKLVDIKKEQKEMVAADSLLTIAIDLAKQQKARQWQINELLEMKE